MIRLSLSLFKCIALIVLHESSTFLELRGARFCTCVYTTVSMNSVAISFVESLRLRACCCSSHFLVLLLHVRRTLINEVAKMKLADNNMYRRVSRMMSMLGPPYSCHSGLQLGVKPGMLRPRTSSNAHMVIFCFLRTNNILDSDRRPRRKFL
jgi:hypothetical protein